jgi:hypothetical protein
MATPPGFNANDSLLPDPGANSVPIHVMRGGGRGGGSIKQAFGMFPGGPLGNLPLEVQDGFVREVEAYKQPGAMISTYYIKQVIPLLNTQRKSYLRNIIKVYKDLAEKMENKQAENEWKKTVANTENVIRRGQYIIEAGTGKVPNINQPLAIASTIEENPANFSAGIGAGKPSAMRTNYSRNFPYSTNAVVGTRKLRISGKTPYYATKRYGAEMNASKQVAPITAAAMNWGATAAPVKKPGFFSRIKSWFSRKKGGRRRKQSRNRGTKRRN